MSIEEIEKFLKYLRAWEVFICDINCRKYDECNHECTLAMAILAKKVNCNSIDKVELDIIRKEYIRNNAILSRYKWED